jgi:hypothetical protein
MVASLFSYWRRTCHCEPRERDALIQFVRVISAKEPHPYHSCLEPCVWCFPASEQALSTHRAAWIFLVVSCFHGWHQDHPQAYLR